MGVGRGALAPSWILKFLAKKVVFLVSSGKNQISPLLAPPGKIEEKNPSPGKNPSDALVCDMQHGSEPNANENEN